MRPGHAYMCHWTGSLWVQVMAWRLFGATTIPVPILTSSPWWRHQMETFSALLALCAGNSPVTGEFPSQRPVTRRFDVFFHLRLNKRAHFDVIVIQLDHRNKLQWHCFRNSSICHHELQFKMPLCSGFNAFKQHDDVMTWQRFPHCRPSMRGCTGHR